MARQKTQVEYNNFTNGFVTEASPLTYPENASIDEQNMNINRDGTRQRRFGLDWTDSSLPIISSSGARLVDTGHSTSNFLWKSAGNNGIQNLGVLQYGRALYFFNVDADDPSSDLLASQGLSVAEYPDPTVPVSMTAAYGKLLVATGNKEVLVFSWDGSVLSKQSYSIDIRDRFGVDDNLDVDERPTSLTANHEYNLRNQGWKSSTVCAGNAVGSIAPVTTDPVVYTWTSTAFSPQKFPSNADLIWASKLGSIVPGSAFIENLEAYSPWELDKVITGTTPAPKGKFIIDLFERSVSRIALSGLGAITTDITIGGISDVASFAGRIWYAVREDSLTGGDDKTPTLGNMVLYSQATEDIDRWKSCHTRNDPSSDDFSDVLDSDGGYISIPEAGEIYKMIPLGEALYVFSSNGVWEVFGGDTGFSASVQSVVKITEIGPLSERPIVAGDNSIGYWAESGIYTISLDQTSLRGIATNLTENSIQTYYDDIPIDLKKQATGIYDPISRQAIWLYNQEAKDSEFLFDKELILDVNKLTFTKRNIPSVDKTQGAVYPTTHFRLRNLVQGISDEEVTVGGVTVTDSGVPVTVIVSDAEQKTKTSIMYWVNNYTDTIDTLKIGAYQNFSFLDYPEVEDSLGVFGNDAEAFILTGYLTGGDSSRVKWFPYISVKSKRTESGWVVQADGSVDIEGESSCLMQTQWEWTNNALSGKWGRTQQVYRLPRFQLFDESSLFSHDVINTRNKIRGSGRALSLRFSSEPGKDMYILGWGVEVSVKESV